MRRKTKYLFLGLAVLVAALACSLPGVAEPTREPVQVSTETVEDLKESLEGFSQGSGEVSLTLTEAQLTSLVALQLQQQQDPLITEPQVHLQDGQIIVTGKTQQGVISTQVEIVLTATVDAQGKPVIVVESADFGPIPVPSDMLAGISGLVDQILTSQLGAQATGVQLTQIAIAEGTMTITVHKE